MGFTEVQGDFADFLEFARVMGNWMWVRRRGNFARGRAGLPAELRLGPGELRRRRERRRFRTEGGRRGNARLSALRALPKAEISPSR